MASAVITISSSDSESDSDLPPVVLGFGGGRSDDKPATEVVEPEEDENFLQIVYSSDEEDEVETLISEDEVLVDTQPEESVLTVADSDSDEEEGPPSNRIVQYIAAENVLGDRFIRAKRKRPAVFNSDDSDGYVSF